MAASADTAGNVPGGEQAGPGPSGKDPSAQDAPALAGLQAVVTALLRRLSA